MKCKQWVVRAGNATDYFTGFHFTITFKEHCLWEELLKCIFIIYNYVKLYIWPLGILRHAVV
jgi:hypothetical protein